MKLSEFWVENTESLAPELPAALERAHIHLDEEERQARIRQAGMPTYEQLIVMNTADIRTWHTNITALECHRFLRFHGLPLRWVQYGLRETEDAEVEKEMFVWSTGYTGHYSIDIETLAASQRVVEGFLGLRDSGIIEVTYVNETIL